MRYTSGYSKPFGVPLWRSDVGKNPFIVVEEKFTHSAREVVPRHGELRQHVSNGAVRVRKVQPGDTDREPMIFGVFERFCDHGPMFDAPCHAFDECFLGFQLDVVVGDEKGGKSSLNDREEDAAFYI